MVLICLFDLWGELGPEIYNSEANPPLLEKRNRGGFYYCGPSISLFTYVSAFGLVGFNLFFCFLRFPRPNVFETSSAVLMQWKMYFCNTYFVLPIFRYLFTNRILNTVKGNLGKGRVIHENNLDDENHDSMSPIDCAS